MAALQRIVAVTAVALVAAALAAAPALAPAAAEPTASVVAQEEPVDEPAEAPEQAERERPIQLPLDLETPYGAFGAFLILCLIAAGALALRNAIHQLRGERSQADGSWRPR